MVRRLPAGFKIRSVYWTTKLSQTMFSPGAKVSAVAYSLGYCVVTAAKPWLRQMAMM